VHVWTIISVCLLSRLSAGLDGNELPYNSGPPTDDLEDEKVTFTTHILRSRDSSVVIATDYGLDGPGSNPGRDEIFRTRSDRTWVPPNLLYNGCRVFPRGKAAAAWC
jgi:hypothetical protein